MRRVLAGVLLVFAALCALPRGARAGPWAQPPGRGYFKTWIRWLPGFGYNAGNGQTLAYGGYHELSLNTYAEVGLGANVTAWFNSPLVALFALEDPRTRAFTPHVAPGDPIAGARWQFLDAHGVVASLGAAARMPFAPRGAVQPVIGPAPAYAPIGALQIGAGVADVVAELAVGFARGGYYAAASGAYVLRTGGFDHVASWTAEGGGSAFNGRLAYRARVTGWHPLGNGTAPRHESPSGIGNGTSYVGLALEGEYRFAGEWVVGLALEGGLFAVRRQTGGPVIAPYIATRF